MSWTEEFYIDLESWRGEVNPLDLYPEFLDWPEELAGPEYYLNLDNNGYSLKKDDDVC